MSCTADYPARGFNQVVDDGIGAEPFGWTPLLDGAVSGSHQDTPAAESPRQGDIHPTVSNRERAHRIDAQVAHGAIHQREPGFRHSHDIAYGATSPAG